jgi:hypothetical protein
MKCLPVFGSIFGLALSRSVASIGDSGMQVAAFGTE